MTTETRHELATRVAAAEGLLVGLDFDGTLAPIDSDPDAPTITRAARRAVERFVASPADATVAVISGRELSDLRRRVGIDGVVYAGNHGLELARGERSLVHPVAKRRRPALRRSLERLRDRLTDVPGWEIEDKGLTASIHVRHTPARRVDEVRSAVEASVREAGEGLSVATGKQVLEIRPTVDWDKGRTIDHLSAGTPDRWLTMYLGDDVTDEDAFRAIRPDGVPVLVGTREDTAATHRLPEQKRVAPFLEWVADCLLERAGREDPRRG